MSNNDSFIDEVNEEVRRDKLYALFRKYGWIGVVAVLADRRRLGLERIHQIRRPHQGAGLRRRAFWPRWRTTILPRVSRRLTR